jgi:hypothetical protein
VAFVSAALVRAIVACAISLALHAHARADAPDSAANGCGKASTASVAESSRCAESTAGDEQPRDLHSNTRRSRWYGWQTMLADGLSLGLVTIGFGHDLPGLGILGISGLLLAAPIVHFAHNNVFGMASLGLRLACAGLIFVGLGAARSEFDSEDDEGGAVSLILTGVVLGGVTSLVDAAFLAFERSSTVVAPYVDARGGVGLQMVGRL